MELDGTVLVIAIIAVSYAAWLANNWIRARNGYALEDEWGGKTERIDTGETARLREENRALHGKLDTMQDRMVVLEKIVTDRGYSVAQEIEALRDQRRADGAGAGVPLGLGNTKERT